MSGQESPHAWYSTVGQGLWQHDGVILWSLVLLLVEFSRGRGGSAAGLRLQGLAAGCMLACRLSAAVFLVHTVADALRSHQAFPDAVLSLIESLLFVIIVLELFTTVVSHFREGGFQLKPFLIIGVVSGVRHVLTAGARTALDAHFNKIMIELGVNTGIVVALVVALVLVHRSERPGLGGGIEE